MGVAVPGNPCPVAVGVAVCSREDALARQTGKLVEVKQVRGYTPYILFRLAKLRVYKPLLQRCVGQANWQAGGGEAGEGV